MTIRHPGVCRSRSAGVGLAVVIACSALGVTAVPADASILSPGKAISLKDAIVTARCSMSVQSVSASGTSESVKIGLSAQPTYLSGYLNNVFTGITCSVATPSGDPQNPTYLASYAIQKNSPIIPSTSNVVTIALTTPLLLCASAVVVLKDGTVHFLGQQCA